MNVHEFFVCKNSSVYLLLPRSKKLSQSNSNKDKQDVYSVPKKEGDPGTDPSGRDRNTETIVRGGRRKDFRIFLFPFSYNVQT